MRNGQINGVGCAVTVLDVDVTANVKNGKTSNACVEDHIAGFQIAVSVVEALTPKDDCIVRLSTEPIASECLSQLSKMQREVL